MTHNWYALQTKPRKEQFVIDQLSRAEIDYYYPALGGKPFFPGYLFVCVDLNQLSLSTLNHVRGSRGLVQFGEWPEQVPDHVIADVKGSVAAHEAAQQQPIPQGAAVTITQGALAGYAGTFNGYSSKERIFVLLSLLGNNTQTVTVARSGIAVA